MRNGVEKGIGKVKSVNKKLGGDMEKDENKKYTIGIGGNSNCAVLDAFGDFTCNCR